MKCFGGGPECYLRFKPLRPDIPIYLSAFGEDFLRLSGEIGDGSLPMITPPASAKQMIAPIREGLSARSDTKNDYMISGCGWLSLSEKKDAASEVMKNMAAYFGPYLEDHALETIGLRAADFAPLRELVDAGRMEEARDHVTPDMLRLGIAGTPAEVIAQIQEMAEAGVNEVNLGGPLGPDPEEAIRLMGEGGHPRLSRPAVFRAKASIVKTGDDVIILGGGHNGLACACNLAGAGPTAGCVLNAPSCPGLIRIRADRRSNCMQARSKDRQTILRKPHDPGGALSALTESQKRSSFFLYSPNRKNPSSMNWGGL